MGKFFKSLWRGVVMVFTLGAVRLDKESDKIAARPDVIDSEMKDIVKAEIDAFNTQVSAIARYQAEFEKTKIRLRKKIEQETRLKKVLAGAKRQAKKRSTTLQKQGLSREEILADAEFKEHQERARDFASTLAEMNDHIEDLKEQLTRDEGQLSKMKRDAERKQRSIEKLKRERGEMVSKIVSAKARKDAAQVIAGVANSGTAEKLQAIRDRVTHAEAEANVIEGVANIDSVRAEEEYLDEVRNSEADDDFLNDVLGDYGLEDEAVAPSDGNSESKDRVQFPE